MKTFSLRAVDSSDLQGLTDMLDATTQHWVGRPTTTAQVTDRLNTPNTETARDTRCAVDDDGTIVGFAHLWPTQTDVIRCFARTHPAHRSRGVGTALQDWILSRAAEIAGTASAEQTRVVSTTSWPGDTGAESLLAGAGYQAERYFSAMVIDLSRSAPRPAPLSGGVFVRTFKAEDTEALFDAFIESFAEHWGFEHPSSDEWWRERRDSAASGFDPTLWHLAMDGEQIAGFVIARRQVDADGITHGYVGDLGVRPGWRGRGVGEALLTRSLETLRERGVPYARLDVDTENTSGAVRLYTKIGMLPRPSFTIWEQTLQTT